MPIAGEASHSHRLVAVLDGLRYPHGLLVPRLTSM